MDIREQILAADDVVKEPIDLPEWGSPELFVKRMSGTERDSFEASMRPMPGMPQQPNLVNVRSRLAVRTLVKANGERVFSDADAEALGYKSGTALERIFLQSRRLNKLDEKDIEELAGNSKTVPSDSSTSA